MSDRAQPETVTVSDVTELVVIPPSDALAIFTAQVTDGEPHPIDKILARIRAEIEAALRSKCRKTVGGAWHAPIPCGGTMS